MMLFQKTMMLFQKNERVKVTFYGQEREATVAKDQASMIVFVIMEDNGREAWFFADSLTRLT